MAGMSSIVPFVLSYGYSSSAHERTGGDMKRFSLLLAVFSLAPALAAKPSKPAATFTANKPAYAAGETVTLRGEHWSPGEPVTIVIAAEGGEAMTLRTTADSGGAFTLTTAMPDGNAAPGFHAAASGAISKLSVQAAFSEGEAETDGAHLLQLEDYWNDRLTFPTGKFNPGWVRKAAEQDKHVPRGVPHGKQRGHGLAVGTLSWKAGALVLNSGAFTSLGPQPERMTGCSGCFNYTTTQGRVNNIAIDPTTTTNGSIVAYAATVGGGVWKTTNCCSSSTTWTVVTDDPLIAPPRPRRLRSGAAGAGRTVPAVQRRRKGARRPEQQQQRRRRDEARPLLLIRRRRELDRPLPHE